MKKVMELNAGDIVKVTEECEPQHEGLIGAQGTVLDGNADGMAPWIRFDEDDVISAGLEGKGGDAFGMGPDGQCFIFSSYELEVVEKAYVLKGSEVVHPDTGITIAKLYVDTTKDVDELRLRQGVPREEVIEKICRDLPDFANRHGVDTLKHYRVFAKD